MNRTGYPHMNRLRVLLILALTGFAGFLQAQQLSKTEKILLDKNFIFFSELMRSELPLQETGSCKVAGALDCKDAHCIAAAFLYTTDIINKTGDDLVRRYFKTPALQRIAQKLKQNGSYASMETLPDTAYLRNVWTTTAAGINNIVEVYLTGKAPAYPKIDSISFTAADPVFVQQVKTEIAKFQKTQDHAGCLTQPLLLALKLLMLNGRDEAARYEPLAKGRNRKSFKRSQKTNWASYQYSAILVPGMGPEKKGVRLSPQSAARCDSAAVRYKQGKAPFIVVSGGHVHPYRTPFCEAVEMKEYLVKTLGIPAPAVIIEPYARHTTTNLRNTNRIIYRFLMPVEKPVLIVTDAAQSGYINGKMARNALRDLGYVPYRNIQRLSSWETEYYPDRLSLSINALDPLDP